MTWVSTPRRSSRPEVILADPLYQSSPERITGYWTALLDEIGSLPEVEAVGVGNWIPTGGAGTSFIAFPDGRDPGGGAGYRVVSDDYFDALDIPVLDGRIFEAGDMAETERVVVVNEAMARRFWPGTDPLGQLVSAPSMEAYFHGGTAPWLRIVGVVGDVRHHGFEAENRAEMYVLYRQMPWMSTAMTAVVEARPGQGARVRRTLAEHVRAIDPSLAVEVGSLDDRLRGLLSDRLLVTAILTSFGAVALLLAALGVYGIVAYAVATRTREVAIRAALGADRQGLIALMLWAALRVVLPGAAVGGIAALGWSGLLEALLVDVSATDPLPYVGAVGVLLAVATAAAAVPAVRAARLDPLEALREG